MLHQLIQNYIPWYVKINNLVSKGTLVNVGVPQGIILGPLLFILNINDIFDILPIDAVVAYAYGTAVLCNGRT